MTEREILAEGLADHLEDLEISEAFRIMVDWYADVLDPCCRDCGWLDYAKQEALAAHKRYHALTKIERESVVVYEPADYQWEDDLCV